MNSVDALQALPPYVAIGAGLVLLPALIAIATPFTKIAIVLMILRNALGIQQVPSTFVLNAVALILTAIVLEPVIKATAERVLAHPGRPSSLQEFLDVADDASTPMRGFLIASSTERSRSLILHLRGGQASPLSEQDLGVVIPAFLIDELTRAFQIGLLLYLPFLAVDIIVSTVLVALGLQMMTATIIATPLKILLFTAVDGWALLFENFVASYPVAP
jgi:type III secretion protein R